MKLSLLLVALQTLINLRLSFCSIRSNCDKGGRNARNLKDVVDFFNSEVEQIYVGQYRAVREVRREIENKVSRLISSDDDVNSDESPLLLHLVGPSGTGKSFLAQIIARSFFKPQNCHSTSEFFGSDLNFQAGSSITSAALVAAQIGVLANPVAAAAAAIGGASLGLLGSLGVESFLRKSCKDVDDWIFSCGVAYSSFSDQSEEENAKVLDNGLSKLAAELLTYKHSILVLDDFNFCTGRCQERLKELLLQRSVSTKDGSRVSAKGAIIILTSDLTQTGLDMERGESYFAALEKVEKASINFWGQESFIVTSASIIPFAPLNDGEIIKVVDKMLLKIEREIRFDVNKVFSELMEKDGKNLFKWTGRFICSERTKLQIIDAMHFSIEKKNSRAIVEQLNSMLRKLIKFPVSIGERLSTSRSKMGVTREEKEFFGLQISPLSKTLPTVFYDQDIILEFNPDNAENFLKLVVDDN